MTPHDNDRRQDDERLMRIEKKLDDLITSVAQRDVAIENRVTRLETKAGIFGFIGGIISGIATHWLTK